MGTVEVTIAVGDPQGRQFEDLEVTVDTGSTFTAVPRELLQRLGVPVARSLPSETADGRIVPVDVGETAIRLEGLEFHTPVIFAEQGEPSLLGVVSLGRSLARRRPLGWTTDTDKTAALLVERQGCDAWGKCPHPTPPPEGEGILRRARTMRYMNFGWIVDNEGGRVARPGRDAGPVLPVPAGRTGDDSHGGAHHPG